jgi:exonuclease SbcC
MIIRKLSLINYKQYLKQDIEFPEGLTGIIGKNGAGKSSIFEAILLALFGEIPFTKEYLRTHGAKETVPVEVSLELEVDAKAFTVRREFRGKALAVTAEFHDAAGSLIAKGQKETTAAVTGLLGMGKDAFTRSVFSSQKELGALSLLRGAERREFIRKVIGVSKIDEIQKLIRGDSNRLKNEIEGQRKLVLSDEARERQQLELANAEKEQGRGQSVVEEKEKEYDQSTREYEQAKQEYLAAQKIFKDFSDLKQKQVAAATKLQGAREQQAQNEKRIADAKKLELESESLKKREEEYQVLKAELATLNIEEKKYHEQEKILIRKQSLESETEKLKQEIAASGEDPNQSAYLQNKKKKTDEDVTALKMRQETEIEALTSLAGRLGGIRDLLEEQKANYDRLNKMGPHSACPVCLRPLEDYFEATLSSISEKINSYEADLKKILAKEKTAKEGLKKLKDDIAYIEAQAHKLKIDLVKLEAKTEQSKRIEAQLGEKAKALKELAPALKELGDVRFDPSVYDEKKNAFEKLEKSHERYQSIAGLVKELPRLLEERERLEKEATRLAKEATEYKGNLERIGYSEQRHNEVLARMNKRETDREKKNRELADLRKKASDSRFMAERLAQELDADKQRRTFIIGQEESLLGLKKLDVLMDEFKTAILERVRPAIATEASRLFETLTQGRYDSISIDEDFGFLIQDDGEYFPLDRFSGGERDLADLCLRLSLSKAVQDLEGASSLNFLAFDEIFGSQDRERRFEILQALYKLQEQYRQILIISHIDEMKDEFPKILEVRRTNTGSEAVWL